MNKDNWMYKKTQLSKESKSENQSAGKSSAHLVDNRPSSVAQRKQNGEAPIQKKANNTGLPNNLKSGIENLSGHSMDDVKVHYNSSKPAQLNAHAYAQGTNIHLASGQEKHLPHEAWHVVQQKQGRVKPTLQMKGKVNVNDEIGLEKEADVMGAKALQLKQPNQGNTSLKENNLSGSLSVQRATHVDYSSQTVKYTPSNLTNKTKKAIVGKKMVATLDPAHPIKGSAPGTGGNTDLLYSTLNKNGPIGYGANAFVRGHLLNAHVGGLGVAENLFPITTAVKHAHLEHIEAPVKSLLLGNNTVHYQVQASQNNSGSDFRMNPKSKLACDVSVGGKKLISRTFSSNPSRGNMGLNEEMTNKGFGSRGSGKAPHFNDWITAGIGANYLTKSTPHKLVAHTDRRTND